MSNPSSEFFPNLPAGKLTGICESLGGSADNGSVVTIQEDCSPCTVMQCMMFVSVLNQEGEIIAKLFTPHAPEY